MSEILYRKGVPSRDSAWFGRLEEAINYDGDVVDDKIYYLALGKEELDAYFRQNGVGIILKENANGAWSSLSSRVREVPRILIERVV